MPFPRRSFAPLLAAAVAALLLTGCSGDAGGNTPAGTSPPLAVVATTIQVGALAREVGGDQVNLHILAGPGIDPHDFEPSPGDLRRVRGAAVILRNGIGLDTWLDGAIKNAGGKAPVITITEGVPIRSDEAGDAGAGDADPHAWQNPANDQLMVDNIAAAFSTADPARADTYRANATAYNQKLGQVDEEIRALIATIPPANRKMVTDHDAFGYFIDHYGLTFVGAVIPAASARGEPSARAIAALEDTIRREGVKAIFAESSVDPRVARRLANDTGARIVDDLYGDTLGDPGSGADTIDGMLLHNARTITGALR